MQIGMVAEAEASFLLAMRLKGHGASNTHLVRAMAEMRRGCGRHADAIRLLDKALDSAPREAITELNFLRGAPCRRTSFCPSVLVKMPRRERPLAEQIGFCKWIVA